MTKHIYLDKNLTGVVILGQYENGDIRDALKKFRKEFADVHNSLNKWVYCDHVIHEGRAPVAITVSYEKNHIQPMHILASALCRTQSADEDSLKRYLDDLLGKTGIVELDSRREQFDAEPFRGWALVSARMF